VNLIRAFFRLLFFAIGSIFYICRYLLKAAIVGNDLDRALRIRKQWFWLINKLLGVHVEVHGEMPKESGLLVCNHRSYFDPLVVMQYLLALPVGKAEIETWPIIGYGAKVSGSIFVDRKTKEGRSKARQDILQTLRNGYFVINYPEGTTHINAQTNEFKPALFKDAAAEGFTIYPVVQEYQRDQDAWIGDDTFIRHFFDCFGKKNTYIKLSYGPAIQSDSATELMELSKQWIDKELLVLRKGWHHSDPSIKNNARQSVV